MKIQDAVNALNWQLRDAAEQGLKVDVEVKTETYFGVEPVKIVEVRVWREVKE